MWVDELSYLGVYIVHSRVFKCSLNNTKISFYRAANSVFWKIGQIASEEVTLQIMDSKCIPMLLYGLEACPLLKSDRSSLDFAIDRFFVKLSIKQALLTLFVIVNLFLILNYRVFDGENVLQYLNRNC